MFVCLFVVCMSYDLHVTMAPCICTYITQGVEGVVAYSIEEGGKVGGGGGGDVLGRMMASYQDYVQLWVELLHPTKLKVTYVCVCVCVCACVTMVTG